LEHSTDISDEKLSPVFILKGIKSYKQKGSRSSNFGKLAQCHNSSCTNN